MSRRDVIRARYCGRRSVEVGLRSDWQVDAVTHQPLGRKKNSVLLQDRFRIAGAHTHALPQSLRLLISAPARASWVTGSTPQEHIPRPCESQAQLIEGYRHQTGFGRLGVEVFSVDNDLNISGVSDQMDYVARADPGAGLVAALANSC